MLDVVDAALAPLARRLPASVSRDDLASVGRVALVETLIDFDGPTDEARAYCFVRVRGAMLDELRRLDPLSRRRRDQANAVVRSRDTLAARLGRTPTQQEVASAAGLSVSAVIDADSALAHEAGHTDIAWDSLTDTDAPTPADSVEEEDLRESLRAALDRLPVNHARVLRRYYLDDATLEEIADEMDVSKERIRQIREAGEKKLRADFVVLALWEALIDRGGR
jgi:RNA polymerase sigma factor for flagellar operon FliA